MFLLFFHALVKVFAMSVISAEQILCVDTDRVGLFLESGTISNSWVRRLVDQTTHTNANWSPLLRRLKTFLDHELPDEANSTYQIENNNQLEQLFALIVDCLRLANLAHDDFTQILEFLRNDKSEWWKRVEYVSAFASVLSRILNHVDNFIYAPVAVPKTRLGCVVI
jgi:hypothetical protein